MELSQDWHKRTNVRLVDILSDILKEPRPPKVPKPTHGYTIAETKPDGRPNPEVVTAPGVYFPAKKGNVIPLESRQDGGEVGPGWQPPDWKSSFTPEMEKNFQGWYAERAKNMGLNPNPDDPRHFYDTRGAWLKGHRSTTEHLPDTYKLPGHPSFSDQSIYYRPGMKAGRSEGGLSSFAPEGKQTSTTGPAEAGSTMPLIPKQEGGEVNPSLFKETSYENLGASTQQGIEAGRNTSLLKSTPIHVSPWVSNLESLEPKPLPLTSTLSLASYAPQRIWKPEEEELDTATPPPPPKASSPELTPPPFKENKGSPVFGSDQLAAYNKKYGIAQAPDLYERLKAASGAPGMTPLLSRDVGGATSPNLEEGMTEEERKRRVALLKTAFPIESLASSRVPTVIVPKAQKVEQTPVAGTEPTKPVEGGISGNLSDINKEVLPSGETRYSIRSAEGQGGITTPKGWVRPTQEEALETLRPTLERGTKTRREEALASLGPEPTYYDVHPEERFMEMAKGETKSSIDAIQKSLDDAKNIAQGYGLSQNPKTARAQRDAALKNIPILTEQLARLTGTTAGIPEKIFTSEERVAAAEARGMRKTAPLTQLGLETAAVKQDLINKGITNREPYPGEILAKQAEVKGEGQKGYPDKNEAIKEAKDTWQKMGKPEGFVPSATLGAGNKWVPAVIPPNIASVSIGQISTPEMKNALELSARMWLRGGEPPRFPGMGGSIAMMEFYKVAGRVAKEEGMGDKMILANQMVLKGQKEATAGLIKLRANAGAFEGMVDRNINLMVDISKNLPRTSIPVLNDAIRTGQIRLLSDPNAIKLYDAVQTVVTEYARMMGSMGIGGAVIQNEQRAIANKFIEAGFTHKALVEVSKFLKSEMQNKIDALDSSVQESVGKIPSLPGEPKNVRPGGAAGSRAADFGGNPAGVGAPVVGGEERSTVGGKNYIKRNGQWFPEGE
jgi:hypothetical protein